LIPCRGKYGAFDEAEREIGDLEAILDQKLEDLKRRLG
jgi:hypothetical protein